MNLIIEGQPNIPVALWSFSCIKK